MIALRLIEVVPELASELEQLLSLASVGRKSAAPSAIFTDVLACRALRESIDIFDIPE
jgi:hypothetical protein